MKLTLENYNYGLAVGNGHAKARPYRIKKETQTCGAWVSFFLWGC